MLFGPPPSDTSTPQKTLQSFVSALNRRDRRAMEALVYGSKSNPLLDVAFKDEKQYETIIDLAVSNISVKLTSPTQATLTYLLTEVAPAGGKPKKQHEDKIDVLKVGEKWLLVAPKPDPKQDPGDLAAITMVLVNPALLKLVKRLPVAEQATINLKQIISGTLNYIIDYDDKIQLKPADYYKSIDPYVKDRKAFTSPLDKPGTISFSFNGNLSGRADDSIANPKNTVMYFEGKPEALKFRYNGKALVALCDGSVRMVSPAEAKTLLWK
ncbi:MAG: hypothetical protein QM758_06175 [Armatimonas sp.]